MRRSQAPGGVGGLVEDEEMKAGVAAIDGIDEKMHNGDEREF